MLKITNREVRKSLNRDLRPNETIKYSCYVIYPHNSYFIHVETDKDIKHVRDTNHGTIECGYTIVNKETEKVRKYETIYTLQ